MALIPTAESPARGALSIYDEDFVVIVTRPIVLVHIALHLCGLVVKEGGRAQLYFCFNFQLMRLHKGVTSAEQVGALGSP